MIGGVEWGGINPRRRECRSLWDAPRSLSMNPGEQIFGILSDFSKFKNILRQQKEWLT
jgi:hypothetical protein